MKKACWSIFLLLVSLVCSAGCRTKGVLDYQKERLDLSVTWQEGASSVTCHLLLEAGGMGRDMTLITEDTPPLVITRTNGTIACTQADLSVLISDYPRLTQLEKLFCIPEGATLTSLSREGDTKTLTFLFEGDTYRITTRGQDPLPISLSYEGEDSFQITISPYGA